MLEEQVLQLKSSHLKDRSQASGASEVARTMQAQLEAVSKERGTLLDEVHRLREENAEAKHQLRRLQQQHAAAAATTAARAGAMRQQQQHEEGKQQESGEQQEQQGAQPQAGGTEVERRELQRAHGAELARLEAELALMQRQNAELQKQLQHAEEAAAAAAKQQPGGEASEQRVGASAALSPSSSPTAAEAAAAAGPAVSAAISHQALQQQAAGGSGAAAQRGLPAELAALLPAALYTQPAVGSISAAPDGEAALQLTSSIYLLLDALEQEKQQLVAALNSKQVQMGAALRGWRDECANVWVGGGAPRPCLCLVPCLPHQRRRRWSSTRAPVSSWNRKSRRSSGGWS